MTITLVEGSLVASTVMQLLGTRLMSVLKVRAPFDVMCLFLDLRSLCPVPWYEKIKARLNQQHSTNE